MKVFDFGPMVQEEKLLKDISYLELWWLLFSMEQNQSYARGHYKNYFCEIVLNLDQ